MQTFLVALGFFLLFLGFIGGTNNRADLPPKTWKHYIMFSAMCAMGLYLLIVNG